MEPITLALAAGDYNGIGPEIIIKSLAEPEVSNNFNIVIFGSEDAFTYTFDRFNGSTRSRFESGYTEAVNRIYRDYGSNSIKTADFSPGSGTPQSGQAAYRYLTEAVEFWKLGKCSGIVTAPIVKQTFFTPRDPEYSGQTEWIAHRTGCKSALMIMVKDSLRIGIATTHIPLREIAASLSVGLVREKGELFYRSLAQDFGIDNPRIALCGLNPHCGEGGRFGDEEQTILKPAIESLRRTCGEWIGPLSADTLFEKTVASGFDGILALYHDQGLIPFKMYCGFTGVNFTAGLPLVRTSPAHGVAMGIAGKERADHRGLKEAILLAAKVVSCRTGQSGTG